MIRISTRRSVVLSVLLFSLCVGAPHAHGVPGSTLKLFFLAGQSNMQGHGRLELGNGSVIGGLGSLRWHVNNNPAKYGHLGDGAGTWYTRSDVWVWNRNGTDTGKTMGDHGVTYGVDGDRVGPEVGFGHALGDAIGDQVVLVKTAWGGKSLFVDFRPPTAVANRGGTVGPYYTIMVNSMQEALLDVAAQFPAHTIEIEGFGWHQGFNDRLNVDAVAEYEANMNDLIADLRTELSTPDLRVVIGTTSTGSDSHFDPNNYSGNPSNVANRVQDHVAAQMNVGANDPLAYTVNTRPFWREAAVSPSSQGYHWNQNGESMYLIGESMGEAMLTLLPTPFESWAADPTRGLTAGVNDGPLDDPDFDGILNLLEFALCSDPLVASSDELPGAVGPVTGTWNFEYDRNQNSIPGTTQIVEYTTDLETWTQVPIPATTSGTVTVTPGTNTDHISVAIPVSGDLGVARLVVSES